MDHQKNTSSLLSKLFRFVQTFVMAVLSVTVSVAILIAIASGTNFAGNGVKQSRLDGNLMEKFDNYITNMTSVALDGIIQVKKVYKLSDANLIAPEPNQDNFGTTEDPSSLQSLINKVYQRLEDKNLFFSSKLEILEGSQVHYYVDDTIFAFTWKQPLHGVIYTFSEIKIEDPSQFRRFLADGQFGSEKQYLTSQMATSVNAVVASAGDFYKYRPTGLLVYQNQIERFNGTSLDSCFIDVNGDLLFSKAGELTNAEELRAYVDKNRVRFSLCFGPILIEDGKSCVPRSYPIGEIGGNYSRAALCQLGPLHYLLVTVNDEPGYPYFPTLYSFADALIELGIERAYTLDGGQTATIVMNDQVINRVSYGAERYISDIIYFATAIPDKK